MIETRPSAAQGTEERPGIFSQCLDDGMDRVIARRFVDVLRQRSDGPGSLPGISGTPRAGLAPGARGFAFRGCMIVFRRAPAARRHRGMLRDVTGRQAPR